MNHDQLIYDLGEAAHSMQHENLLPNLEHLETLLIASQRALKGLPSVSVIYLDEDAVEAAARSLAGLDEGDTWPTNEELGGGLTGDRDIEYRAGKYEDARIALEAAHNAQNLIQKDTP